MQSVRIFLDDSGQKEYGPATSRYFVYAGPIVETAKEAEVSGRFAELKNRVFGDPTVEIKSNWMRQPQERRRRYLDPYGISNAKFDAFVEEWYDLMSSADLSYLAAAIDKPQMLARYPTTPWYASATAYQFLLQRYELELRRRERLGHVRVDDMSGSSPAHNEWRELLRSHHARLKADGCRITKLTFDHVASQLVFGNSARFDLLQVADVVAYNVYRQFREHGNEWDQPSAAQVSIYPWLGRILPRFVVGPANQLEGWGIVKWPSDRKSRWVVNFHDADGS